MVAYEESSGKHFDCLIFLFLVKDGRQILTKLNIWLIFYDEPFLLFESVINNVAVLVLFGTGFWL